MKLIHELCMHNEGVGSMAICMHILRCAVCMQLSSIANA